VPLPGLHAVGGRLDLADVPGADRGQDLAGWSRDVDDPPAGQVPLEGPGGFLGDLRPGGVGDRR
jgi:hypothetical protein